MDSVDGLLSFGWDSDLCCPAKACSPNNPSEDGCTDIQPALCSLSGGVRYIYR